MTLFRHSLQKMLFGNPPLCPTTDSISLLSNYRFERCVCTAIDFGGVLATTYLMPYCFMPLAAAFMVNISEGVKHRNVITATSIGIVFGLNFVNGAMLFIFAKNGYFNLKNLWTVQRRIIEVAKKQNK